MLKWVLDLPSQFKAALSVTTKGSKTVLDTPRARSEQRRRKQLEQRQQRSLLLPGATGEDGLRKIHDRKFGFNSILLTLSTSHSELLEEEGVASVSFENAAIRLIALDSAHGDVLFSMEPIMQDPSTEVLWMRLLPGRLSNLLLVLATQDGSLFVWDINTDISPVGGNTYRVASPSRIYRDVFAKSVHTIPGSASMFLLVRIILYLFCFVLLVSLLLYFQYPYPI